MSIRFANTATRIAGTAVLLILAATLAWAKPPRAELAGLRLGMTDDAAHAALAKRGAPIREHGHERESEEHETWSLARGPWSYVSFGVVDERVSWVTAFARTGGQRLRYRDLGSLDACRRTGTYFFIWKVPAVGKARAYSVIARGTDSVYVTSASLTRDPGDVLRDHPALPDSDR